MEIQTMNGHGKKRVVKKAKHAVGKAEHKAASLVKEGERVIEKNLGFVKRNPKSAVGLALGAGLVVGAFANGKIARAAALGLAAFIGKRFF